MHDACQCKSCLEPEPWDTLLLGLWILQLWQAQDTKQMCSIGCCAKSGGSAWQRWFVPGWSVQFSQQLLGSLLRAQMGTAPLVPKAPPALPFLSQPRCEEPTWALQLPPGHACGFIKYHCYFNKLLRTRVCLMPFLRILGYGGERKFGNYISIFQSCQVALSGSVQTICYNLCQMLIQFPLSIAFTCFFQ